MSNYILKYGRDDRVKYISHLDFMRCFHRTVRRTDLQFIFSQGFNPHPVMTIAQPLSVGVTSESEFMKVGFEDGYKPREIVEILNQAFPPGFKVYSCFKLNAKEIDITQIDKALYVVEIEHEGKADIDAFMANKELIVPKKTKSGIKDSDIRPHIFEMKEVSDINGVLTLEMIISVGSSYNLKPETVAEAMEKYCDGFKKGFMTIHRKEMYGGNVERLINIV